MFYSWYVAQYNIGMFRLTNMGIAVFITFIAFITFIYQRLTWSGFRIIGIRKSKFIANDNLVFWYLLYDNQKIPFWKIGCHFFRKLQSLINTILHLASCNSVPLFLYKTIKNYINIKILQYSVMRQKLTYV